jgi:hypothetical protein
MLGESEERRPCVVPLQYHNEPQADGYWLPFKNKKKQKKIKKIKKQSKT